MEAAPGFEPGNNGFADRRLRHLAMPPRGIVAQRDVHESGVTARSYRPQGVGIFRNLRESVGARWSVETGHVAPHFNEGGLYPQRGGSMAFARFFRLLRFGCRYHFVPIMYSPHASQTSISRTAGWVASGVTTPSFAHHPL